MLKTLIILLVTLIVVPVLTWNFGDPLSAMQSELLIRCLWICGITALSCFALAEITGNCSQVDKIWSIVPVVYAWAIASGGGFNGRSLLMAVLVTMWGARLTYNFSRRGAYTWKFWSGEEDYRWAVLRANPVLKGRFRWTMFNLFFISLYQNALILLFTLPMLLSVKETDTQPGIADFVIAAAFIFFLIIETVADQQQWEFQQEKHRRMRNGEKLEGGYAKGFLDTGLWKWMRHPNYMAEQAIWICFYLFTLPVTGQVINWSIAGALLLLVLFQGSSDFSEGISASKYPMYKDYQQKTGRFLPRLFRS